MIFSGDAAERDVRAAVPVPAQDDGAVSAAQAYAPQPFLPAAGAAEYAPRPFLPAAEAQDADGTLLQPV